MQNKILTDLYQVTILVFERTKAMPKHLRPVLGRSLEEKVLTAMFYMRKAMKTKGHLRLKYFHHASDYLDSLKFLIQLAYDLKSISITALDQIMTLITEVGKQIGGLIRFCHQEQKASSTNKSVTNESPLSNHYL